MIGLNNHRTTRAGVPVAGLRSAGLNMVSGAAAGAAGVWAMDQVGWFMLRSENTHTLTRDLQARFPADAAENAGTAAQIRGVQAGTPGRPGTASALRTATQVSGVSSTDQQPGPGATVFHYALGMLPGALYGAVRRIRPSVRTGSGVLYGVALFVVMDETAAPLTGIASAPGRYPWQAHARGLVAHVVLGVTTEILLRATDRLR
ncbi:hypothetical protein [Arthrobacter sp. A5]|uniref:hypothetical protein n=1 Tax=Arthrobacter sp. A5 TaxID=576926 RepID=UPI003DA83E64